jgi:hypothetical protein
MQEMPQTDTDSDGVPNPPTGYFPNTTTGNNHGYPILGYFDNCPFAANTNQKDSVGNRIGDACRCGDVNNDGLVSAPDKTIISRSLAGLGPFGSVGSMPGFTKCDVNGDGLCSVADKTIISRFLANLGPGITEQCHAAVTFP